MRILGFLLLCSMATWSFAQNSLEGIRIGKSSDNTRLVFDLKEPADYTLYELTNQGYRLVLDLKNTSLNADPDALNLTDTGITRIRTGIHGNGLRVVLDMPSALDFRAMKLPPNSQNPYRLVIDLNRNQQQPQVSAPVRTVDTSGRRDMIIVVDAGHGGDDPGAIGPGGTFEKDVALAISKELARLINREQGFEARMVRDADYYVTLTGRRDFARENNADLFVSIHADAFRTPQPSGATVFSLSDRGAESAMQRFLSDSSSQTDTIGGANGIPLTDKDEILRQVLVDLSMNANMSESMVLGRSVISEMSKITRIRTEEVKLENFAVLKSPDVPSILVETGFISNPAEERKLRTPSFQRKMAQAIFEGLKDYGYARAPEGTYVYWRAHEAPELIDYRVSRGDTLSAIAIRHKISLQELKTLNGLRSNNIQIGQVLKVPNV